MSLRNTMNISYNIVIVPENANVCLFGYIFYNISSKNNVTSRREEDSKNEIK